MLTRSYYIFSDDYVSPICSGRFKPGEHAHQVLNDKFSIKTSGTEDYTARGERRVVARPCAGGTL